MNSVIQEPNTILIICINILLGRCLSKKKKKRKDNSCYCTRKATRNIKITEKGDSPRQGRSLHAVKAAPSCRGSAQQATENTPFWAGREWPKVSCPQRWILNEGLLCQRGSWPGAVPATWEGFLAVACSNFFVKKIEKEHLHRNRRQSESRRSGQAG